jgi:hypothetical protein
MVKITNDEIWKDTFINGICVSNKGRVKRKRDNYLFTLRINKSNGYKYADLRRYEKGKMMKVSRLVAITFLPNPENKPCVDHINTIRNDDRVENLRWVTRKENMNNPITLEKIRNKPFRECPKRRKPILQFDINGNFIKEWDSSSSFGKFINKDVCGNIIACIKGKQKTAYGYKWEYKKQKEL